MRKKIIILSILGIIILIGIVFFYNPVYAKCEDTETGWWCQFIYSFPSIVCGNIETGWDIEPEWRCQFRNFNENPSREKGRYAKLEQEYKEKCEKQGGRWKCYGFCEANYGRYCDFPFDDAEKECINSSECKGKCIAVFNETLKQQIVTQFKIDTEIGWKRQEEFLKNINYTCSKPLCEGRCSEYPLRMCDSHESVNNGKIISYMIFCD